VNSKPVDQLGCRWNKTERFMGLLFDQATGHLTHWVVRFHEQQME